MKGFLKYLLSPISGNTNWRTCPYNKCTKSTRVTHSLHTSKTPWNQPWSWSSSPPWPTFTTLSDPTAPYPPSSPSPCLSFVFPNTTLSLTRTSKSSVSPILKTPNNSGKSIRSFMRIRSMIRLLTTLLRISSIWKLRKIKIWKLRKIRKILFE